MRPIPAVAIGTLFVVASLASPSCLAADPGVSAEKIVFGQAAAFEGPASALGLGMKEGLLAAFAEVNAKDLSDTAMLLWDHEPASADGPGLLNLGPVVERCSADWGLYTTVTDNLAAGAELLGSLRLPEADRVRIAGRIAAITDALAAAPKSTRWQLRAKVGRRKRWYETPEEVVR